MRHFLLIPILFASLGAQSAPTSQPSPSLPFAFVENKGQWQSQFTHRASLGKVTTWLTRDGWTLETNVGAGDSEARRSEACRTAVGFHFVDGSSTNNLGLYPQAGQHNWYRGSDSAKWIKGARGYKQVRLESVYSGIDVLLRPNSGVFEYDLVLAPGADLSNVRVHCDGASSLTITPLGDLVITTALGPLSQARPRTWSTLSSGEHRLVECDFVLIDESTYGFTTKSHDTTLPLIVDPGLVWSTYVGGSNTDVIEGLDIAPNGDIVVVGTTKSTDLPTTAGVVMPAYGGGTEDMFVARLSSDGKQFIYVTYLGGNDKDIATSIAADATGTHICGTSDSTDAPTTTDALRTTNAGRRDAYVASLDNSGQLTYGTYMGTAAYDYAHTITVANGLLNISGTSNQDFPTSIGSYQVKSQIKTFIPGFFITLDRYSTPGQTDIAYSTLIGSPTSGGYMQSVHHSLRGGIVTLACDQEITGLPTSAGAFQPTRSGGRGGYLLQLDPTKVGPAGMVYATYCDSTSTDLDFVADADSKGLVTIAMSTPSGSMPTTASAFQLVPISRIDIYVAHLDPSKTGAAQLIYGSYIGGNLGVENDHVHCIKVLDNGMAWIGGSSNSRSFPTTTGAWRRNFEKAGGNRYGMLFKLDFNKSGTQSLAYSTAIEDLGSYGQNEVRDIVIDSSSNTLVIAGKTGDQMAILPGAAQATYGGGYNDGFVMRIDPTPVPNSSTVFGNSCQGSMGMPSLVPVSEAQPKLQFHIEAQNLPAGTPLVFYTGVSKAIWNGQALPMDLTFLGMTGCKIFVSGDVFVSKATSAAGTSALKFRMPADWSLVGITFYNQAIFLDPGANALGVVVTNAVESKMRM